MKKNFIGFVCLAVIIIFGASNAFADRSYDYAEKGFGGQLILQDTPDGIFLSIETSNGKGHTCDLSSYECIRKGQQYQCIPHEGGNPDQVPLVIRIMPDKSLLVQPAKGVKSPDGFGEFCGTGGRLTGKYVPKR